MKFLCQAHVSWSTHTWLFEMAFVQEVGMHVCGHPDTIDNYSDMLWTQYAYYLYKFYS